MLPKLEARNIVFKIRQDTTANRFNEFHKLNKLFLNNFNSIDYLTNIKNQTIVGYYPFACECDVLPILKYCSKNNKICLPVIVNKFEKMIFKEWNLDSKELEPNKLFTKYKILEPKRTSIVLTPTIVFMPAVAVDIFGNRVGYGAGYYDKTLKNLNCIKIATIFNFQLFNEELENNVNDVKVDYILTEDKFIKIL